MVELVCANTARTERDHAAVHEHDSRHEEETFEVSPELEAVLLESLAEADRGDVMPAEELRREMRDRE